MIESIMPAMFSAVLTQGEGYLVNVWPGHGAKAHNLMHLSAGCQRALQGRSHQIKLFATTWEEAQEAADRYNETCKLCGPCERAIAPGKGGTP